MAPTPNVDSTCRSSRWTRAIEQVDRQLECSVSKPIEGLYISESGCTSLVQQRVPGFLVASFRLNRLGNELIAVLGRFMAEGARSLWKRGKHGYGRPSDSMVSMTSGAFGEGVDGGCMLRALDVTGVATLFAGLGQVFVMRAESTVLGTVPKDACLAAMALTTYKRDRFEPRWGSAVVSVTVVAGGCGQISFVEHCDGMNAAAPLCVLIDGNGVSIWEIVLRHPVRISVTLVASLCQAARIDP